MVLPVRTPSALEIRPVILSDSEESRNYSGLLTTFGGSRGFLLRALPPQAAMPAAKKTRAAVGRVPSNPARGAGNESTCGEESDT